MLYCLRHEALVRRHDKHRKVDTARAGEHVLDEPLVPRHIDDARTAPVRKVEARKAEVDRDAALFLLGQPVGVHARERLDELGLAVVDMTRHADDNMLHRMASAAAAAISAKSSSRIVRTHSKYCLRWIRATMGLARRRSFSSSSSTLSLPGSIATAQPVSSCAGALPPPTASPVHTSCEETPVSASAFCSRSALACSLSSLADSIASVGISRTAISASR